MLSTSALVLLGALTVAPATGSWETFTAPLSGPTRVIGRHAGGCIQGAATLSVLGTGHRVVRPARNRHHGHPELVDFVQDLGRAATTAGLGRVLVGDMAQPRGGPMPSGHRSHQNGLDVDMSYRLDPVDGEGSPIPPHRAFSVSMVRGTGLDPRHWSPAQATLLRLAAEDPRVRRIFVNPVIKRALCQAGRQPWLHQLRPWWGHDGHFHVRLSCPPGDSECIDQAEPPAGDGCDEDLDGWVRDRHRPPARRADPPPLPPACAAVLDAEGGGRSQPSDGVPGSRSRATEFMQ